MFWYIRISLNEGLLQQVLDISKVNISLNQIIN
nr:MAG TPA: hypothetical protein [Caudoviricetes sp.]